MDSLIFLPPLSGQGLRPDSTVTVLHNTQLTQGSLSHCLSRHPKATLALHPCDAPLKRITLPPLSAQRRDAALRVKLEDEVLGDTSQLVFSQKVLSKTQFEISYVDRSVLEQVMACLNALGKPSTNIISLSSVLPDNSALQAEPWVFWRDDTGAGAVPLQDNDNELPVLTGSHIWPAIQRPVAYFAQSRTHSQHWQQWRWPIALLLACILVACVGSFWHWRSLLKVEQHTQQQISTAFTQALPDTPMVDALVQLQRAGTGGTALTSALQQLPEQWQQGAVTQITWVNSRLSVTVNASKANADAKQQAALTEQLAAKNITLIWSAP